MYKRYFRKEQSLCSSETVEWIEMSGREYYCFVTDPQNRDRYFVDMGDVVLECSEAEYKKFKAEDDHSSYILEQEDGWITQSLEDAAREKDIRWEDLIEDLTQDVEAMALHRIELGILYKALTQLDAKSYQLIYSLYLAKEHATEKKLANAMAVSQSAINKQKKKILKTLKILVIKFSKSSQ